MKPNFWRLTILGALSALLSSCATVTIPVSVQWPPAVDLGRYHRFAFENIDGTAAPRFKEVLSSGLPRWSRFSFSPAGRLETAAAEYDLAKSDPGLKSKARTLEASLDGSAFISGSVDAHYDESIEEQPDTCVWKNHVRPCPLRTRIGKARVEGRLDFTDALTGKPIYSRPIRRVCQRQTQARNAAPGAIDRDGLESRCVAVAANELLSLLLPSQRLFYPSFVKVKKIPGVQKALKTALEGRMSRASDQLETLLRDPRVLNGGFSPDDLSALYFDAGLTSEYSWKFDKALGYFKKAQALSPRKDISEEKSRLLSLEAERRRLMGITPLMLAAQEGATPQVRTLLGQGADPNAQDSSGDTALMRAARSKNAGIVGVLLKAGASPDIRNNSGLAAADMTHDPATLALLTGPAPTSEKSAETENLPGTPRTIRSDVDVPDYHEPEDSSKIALVVGIENYANDLPSAEFAAHDAEVMRAYLLAMGYAPRHIRFLENASGTRAALAKDLEGWLPSVVDSSSTVLFYYSGHGALDPQSKESYIVPSDGDPDYLEETAYPLSRLYKNLESLKARRVIALFDSCFSGRGGRSLAPRGVRPLVTAAPLKISAGNIAVLTAASGSQIADTLASEGHGLFTYYLLKGLNGAALSPARDITVQSLYDYLRPQVEDAAALKNIIQDPQILPRALLGAPPLVIR